MLGSLTVWYFEFFLLILAQGPCNTETKFYLLHSCWWNQLHHLTTKWCVRPRWCWKMPWDVIFPPQQAVDTWLQFLLCWKVLCCFTSLTDEPTIFAVVPFFVYLVSVGNASAACSRWQSGIMASGDILICTQASTTVTMIVFKVSELLKKHIWLCKFTYLLQRTSQQWLHHLHTTK